jgi:mono/diheme cytochrome c family protein
MSMMSIKNMIVVVTSLFVFPWTVAAQKNTPAPPAKVIQRIPVKAVSPASGKDMYMSYCAVCHGTDGKGGGPAASALKIPPTDLTLLTKTNGGKYPALKVTSTIRGETALPSHGSKEMPVWGTLFWSMSSGHQSEVQQRVVNLTHYIETMQAK